MTLGESDYRRAGLERLRESQLLLRQDLFAGAVYLAGRAVESMLRAVIWRNDSDIRAGRRSLDTGHNLPDLLTSVANLGALRSDPQRDALTIHVQHVARLWFNNMRFIPTGRLKTRWWELGEISGKRTLKVAAYEFYDASSAIVKQCEAICQR